MPTDGTAGFARGRKACYAGQVFVRFAILLLLGLPVAAAEELEPLPETGTELADVGHARVSRAVTDLAGAIDSFFSDARHEESINRTRIRIGSGIRIAEHDGVDPLLRLQLNLHFPAMSRRLNLVVAGFSDDEGLDAREAQSPEDNDLAGFLRFFVFPGAPDLLAFDAGLRFRPAPDPFFRARMTRAFVRGRFLFRPTQFFYWQLDEGLGARTRLDLDRRINPKTLVRLRGQFRFSQETDGVELKPAFFLYRRIDRRSWLRFELSATADTDPARVVERYQFGVRYRRNVWRRWLFVELEPQIRFEDERDYDPAAAIDLRVEAILGGRYGT